MKLTEGIVRVTVPVDTSDLVRVEDSVREINIGLQELNGRIAKLEVRVTGLRRLEQVIIALLLALFGYSANAEIRDRRVVVTPLPQEIAAPIAPVTAPPQVTTSTK